MKKRVIFCLILAVAGAAAWFIHFRNSDEVSGESTYKTVEIKRGDLENIISSTGTLSAVSTVDVGSQVSGILETVNVDFNDTVVKGQVLAELDTLLLKAAVRDAEANLLKAKAQYAQSKAELDRNRILFDKGYLSESEFLTYSTDLDVKAATVAGAESSLFKAKTNLNYGVIKSPIDGIVIQRSVDPGQTIAASLQTPQLFIIAEDLSSMKIEVSVDESDIGSITEGMPVRFDVQAYPDLSFDGIAKQVRLQPETISNVVNYTVIVNAENTEGRLLPGMTATVDFVVDQVQNVILVSNAALKYQPDRDLMQKLREKRQKSEGSGAGQPRPGNSPGNGTNGRGSHQIDVSRVFLKDQSGEILPLVFIPGVTDGAFTEVKEILRGPEEVVGMSVIVSSTGEKNPGKPKGMMSMGGPPPGGRGMRRSGL
jgi:HlyD family secretion protein